MNEYYDGTKLLSLTDINGNKPEIYMCTANNTAGKTTYFSRLLVNRFFDKGDKFMLVYRFSYELAECADKFYKDIGNLFFKGTSMESKARAKGSFHELFIDGVPCGYAVSLNNVDNIKKYSHLFNDTMRMFMDEFQSETNHYCPNEVNKFRALHKAVARGNGEMVRYVPVYMCANPITILNPYYVAMNISSRLNSNVKYLRGDGFVLEQGYNEAASKAQKQSGFNRAFGDDAYSRFTAEAVYLNDNYAFVEKPTGASRYIATLKYEGVEYGVREYAEKGIVYCDDRADATFPIKITVTTEDHNVNYVMLKRNDLFLFNLRYYFEHGCFRFKDLRCKEAVLKALSY
jgi:hypothetical protein